MNGAIGIILFASAVELIKPSCEITWLDVAALEELLELEASRADWIVSIDAESCDTEPLLVELADKSGTKKRLAIVLRDVDLEQRARTAALAISEHFQQTAPPPPPKIEPPPPPKLTRTATVAPVEELLGLLAGGTVRLVPGYETTLFGARVGLVWPLSASLALEGGASIERATNQHPLGDLSLWLLSFRGALLYSRGSDGIRVGVGPTLEAGRVWAKGTPRDETAAGESADDFVVLAGAQLAAVIELDAQLALFLEFELSGALKKFDGRADETGVIGIGDLLAGGAAGIRVGL